MRSILIFAITIAITGCAGRIFSDFESSTNSGVSEGVVVYPPKLVMEVYMSTLRTNGNGEVIGNLQEGSCAVEFSAKFSTRADYENPYFVKYQPGILENNSFGVTLNEGMVSGINSSSDTASGLASVTGALGVLLPYVAKPQVASSATQSVEGEAVSSTPRCNAGHRLYGVYDAPPVLPYDKAPIMVGNETPGGSVTQ